MGASPAHHPCRDGRVTERKNSCRPKNAPKLDIILQGRCSHPITFLPPSSKWRSQSVPVGGRRLTAWPAPRIDSVHLAAILPYAALIRYITICSFAPRRLDHIICSPSLHKIEVCWSGFEYLSLIKSNLVEPCRPVPYDPSRRALVVIAALFTSLHNPPYWAPST